LYTGYFKEGVYMTNAERQAKYLEAHRDEVNQKRRERYQSLIAEQKCPRCGRSVKARANKGRKLCKICLENARVYREQ
jgi:predicted RNA-binding Zn-ribbon protein involved in translation (DUF1610 family)